MQKMKSIVLMLGVLAVAFLAGCQYGDSFPFYLMEEREDYSEVLYVDGVQYVRKPKWDENANYYNGGYAWTPTEGIGEQIGVCGEDINEEASLKVYEVAGDEEHIFLYTWPAHFYFGGVETRLWMRDGVTLGAPTAEMVSSVTLVSANEDSTPAHIDDPDMIAALLEAFEGDSIQTRNGEGWVGGSLIMHHKDFPFLQYEIECCYSPEQEISYCRNADREWLPLPAEWYAVISEHDFPTRDE